MKKQIFGLMLLGLLLMISCTKETEIYSDESVADLILETRGLTNDCFEFVFPVSFQMRDSSIIVVNSNEELEALKGEEHGRLRLVFPVNIINSAGEPVVVEDHEQMRQILEDCGIVKPHGKGGKHGKHGKGGPGGWIFHAVPKCYEIVFPVSVIFPDSSVVQIADKKALLDNWKAWKEANPGVTGGPHIQFPIQVIKKGETEPVIINSKEELMALRKNC